MRTLCLILIACALCLSLFAGCSTQQHLALGSLERERIALSATASETIVALPVSEGSVVSAGTLLVQLDTQLQQTAVDLSDAKLAQATAQFDKVRNGARSEDIAVASAHLQAQQALLTEQDKNLKRSTALVKQNVNSSESLDKAQAQRDSAAAAYTQAKAELRRLTNGSRSEDRALAQAALDAARATQAREHKLLTDLSIIAPRAGIVDHLPWHLGERVSSGSPVAIMLADTAPYARVYIPAARRAAISSGSQLRVHIDDSADATDTSYLGTVTWISSDPAFTPHYALNQEERSHLMYLCTIQLPEAAHDLASGLPVSVELP